ncbi:hypothetical protein DFH28DRAFT_952068 [Melampsora americana]|nr:hypothetical protein DFH28DRAFT_970767 [Melampsora americana]KAH9821281.1 hypothetical protein DFH28DRAFT_952068 [Melampsora americana]
MPKLNSNSPRLITVLNQLPVTITAHSSEETTTSSSNTNYSFKMSSGGLVSALSGCKRQMSLSWIGWSVAPSSPPTLHPLISLCS